MALWSGIGMNYGHNFNHATYSTAQVEADFSYFVANGITRVRIMSPQYDDATGFIADCQDMVSRALSHGLYVVWAVVCGYGADSLTATRWVAWKSYITSTFIPYAISSGLSEAGLGNEHELSADNTTLTATTIRADIRSLATTIKSGTYTGKVSYSTSISDVYYTPWVSEGIGVLDLIGWNDYDLLSNFQRRSPLIVSNFGTHGYVSEFGCTTHGYADYNDEVAWYTDAQARIASLRASGVGTGYFFCYRDGANGVPANSFALVKTDGTVRIARNAVFGVPSSGWCMATSHT